jgi:hypothetical protein
VGDGCRIKELPDGGKEFVLDDRALSFVRIDDRTTLGFGRTEVAIGGPFVLRIGGVTHALDPGRRDTLGAVLTLYPRTVRWLWASPDGRLAAVFEDGALVTVDPSPAVTAWSVGNVANLPGAPQ